MTAPVVPDAGQDPTGYVLAAADLREKRAKAATAANWRPQPSYPWGIWQEAGSDDPGFVSTSLATNAAPDAVHIAAEANPEHALAEVALWREVAVLTRDLYHDLYPHPLMAAAVAAARAYLTGAGT